MNPRNSPCPCNSGKKVKHCCRSEARCYALIRLGKRDGLTAEDRLRVMRWECEFEEEADKVGLMELAIKERV